MTSPADHPYLPDEAAGTAPGRARLTGRRILVVGAGTRPCPDPDPPMGNGRAISVLAAREGAAVACADKDRDAAQETARLARAEGGTAEVLVADVAEPQACADLVTAAAAALGGLDGLVLNVGFALGRAGVGRRLRGQHPRALPGLRGRPAGAGPPVVDRLHQLRGQPAGGHRGAVLRRVQGGLAGNLPASRQGGPVPAAPCQPGWAQAG